MANSERKVPFPYVPTRVEQLLFSALLRIRPAQLGDFIKRMLRIRRRYVATSWGGVFWLDPVSVFGQHLLNQQVHEPSLTQIVHGLLSEGQTFVDVGANEGYYSILAAKRVGKGGLVHAIEPQSRIKSVLEENKRINCAEAMVINNVAFSETVGTGHLFLRPSANTGASSLYRHWKVGSRGETVPTLTLDEFFKRSNLARVRLMKIDCEGAEHLVVTGGRQVLGRQAIDYIALDYHASICGKETCAGTHSQLQSLGYRSARLLSSLVYYRPGMEQQLADLGETSFDCSWDA